MRTRTSLHVVAPIILLAAVATSAYGLVIYNPGWIWDSWSVSGPANTRFDIELHNVWCNWTRVDTGTTNSGGSASGSVWRSGPGCGYQPSHNLVRVVFQPSGTIQGGLLGGNVNRWSYNANAPGIVPASFTAGQPGTSTAGFIVIAQNDPETVSITGQKSWLRDGSFFRLRLPEHFVFAGLPVVQASNPGDLVIGPPGLGEGGRLLWVPVLSNARTDPFGQLIISDASLNFDGQAPADFHWPHIAADVVVTPAEDPWLPLAEFPAESFFRWIIVTPDPLLSWFDETLGGGGAPSFAVLQAAYAAWLHTPDCTVSFEELPLGTKVTDQYDPLGIWFSGTDGGDYNTLTGVQREGDPLPVQDVTGYDGSYQPNGSNLYIRFQNTAANPDAPVTMTFGGLQRRVGGFLGCGTDGVDHSFTVTAYGDAGEVLGTRVYTAEPWEPVPPNQNNETFFGVEAPFACIKAVSVQNNSPVQFADALLLDNVAWDTWPTTPFGDRDRDNDVDQSDFALFAECMTGPAGSPTFVPPEWECQAAFDVHTDTDVDVTDFARFQREYTGETL